VTFLDIARPLAERGFRVFPLVPKDKRPVKMSWGDHFDAATTDISALEQWDAEVPRANVGISPDENFCFLETDDEAALREVCAELPPEIWDTARVSARDNRCYFIFRQTMRTRKTGNMTVTREGKENLFEFKQHRVYVTGPGSIHPKTDKPYGVEWRPIPAMPDVLLHRLEELYTGGPKTTDADTMDAETTRQTALLDSFLGTYEVSTTGDWFNKGKQWYRPIVCPWEDTHENSNQGTSTCVVYTEGGGYGFDCKHRCASKTWKEFRAEVQGRFPDRKFSFVEQTPEIVMGRTKKDVAQAVEIVEQLDPELKATPLPRYPLEAWEGTIYLEFAKRAAAGNFVPLEFFVEGAMTYAGAIAGINVRHAQSDEITLRMYTVLLASAGIGKGTTFRRIRSFAPGLRVMDDVDPERAIPKTCSALLSRPASENGLNDSLLKHAHVLLEFEEMDQLMGKTEIKGNNSLMSIIRTCFDDIKPGITTCTGRPDAATAAFLSLLGAMTPSLWRKSMEGRDSYGSGLGGRFNLVASNEDRTASTLLKMDIGDLQERLEKIFSKLEFESQEIDTEPGALNLLADWWDANHRGKPHYNRVNVIAHRKALHLAWIRGMPVITPEIMRQALKLAEYLIGVRDVFAVSKGDDKTAIGENKILHILRQIGPKAVAAKQVVAFLDGMMSRASVFNALKSLTNSGEVEQVQVNPVSGRSYAVYRVSLKAS
jgi:Bifunctional DNA primase/polymerase, N-terminal